MMTLSDSADALDFSTTTKNRKDEDCSISHGPLEKLSLSLVFASEKEEKSGRGFKDDDDGPGDVLSTPLTVRRRERKAVREINR